ncbi:hypothetical protein [Mycobacterium asiaticum]|nr:hypothetical protein [Mycobacterium asiaticum]
MLLNADGFTLAANRTWLRFSALKIAVWFGSRTRRGRAFLGAAS